MKKEGTPPGLHLWVCEGGTPTNPYADANTGTTQRRFEKDTPHQNHRRSEYPTFLKDNDASNP